jgi:hypothetical protein
MEKNIGHYLGTEIDEKWWKRYMQDGFLARGNGTYWFDRDAFCFRRYLTEEPLRIPYSDMENFSIGDWHAGRWNLGRPVAKIHWEQSGMKLSSGFAVDRDKSGTETFIAMLIRHMHE